MRPASRYSYTFQLPLDVETAFSLLADPSYLDRLTPPWFRLEPQQEPPPVLGVGSEISYRLRWRGLPLCWTSTITDWVPNEFFAYEQKRGPYLFFRHEHFFEPIERRTRPCESNGAKLITEVRDVVVFRTPGGRFADRWIAQPDLRRIFEFRERRVEELLREDQAGGLAGRLASRMPRTKASSSVIERPT